MRKRPQLNRAAGKREVKKVCLVVGAAEGGTELNAFDKALLAAGIGDVNLVKVSSIVPPGVELVEELNPFPKGEFVPVVYVMVASGQPGQRIAAAIGVGREKEGFGVVMEAKGDSREEVEEKVREMILEAFEVRGLSIEEVKVVSVEHEVRKCGCVVAACVFF